MHYGVIMRISALRTAHHIKRKIEVSIFVSNKFSKFKLQWLSLW